MAIAFVKNGGVNAVKAAQASLAVTVPAGGHAVGNLVVVAVAFQVAGTGISVAVTDTRGNSYTPLEATPPVTFSSYCYVFASVVGTTLNAGDTITATFSGGTGGSPSKIAVSSMEFSGASITEDVASLGSESGTGSPSVGPITPPSAAVLLIGAVEVNATSTLTEDADTVGGSSWVSGPIAQTTGGSGSSNITSRAAYKITTSSAAQTYNPTSGTSANWRASLVALKAGVTVLTASPSGLASPQAFGAIATAKGPVSLTATGLASPQAFGAPTFTVRGPPQTVQVAGVYPPGAVYQASITGAVIVGDGHVVGGGWSYAAQFGTVTALNAVPATNVPVGGVPSAQAFGAVTPSARVTIPVTGKTSVQAFGSLAFRVTLSSGGVLTAQTFGVPTAKAVVARTVGSVPSSQAFGAVTVTTTVRPTAGGVSSAQAFGTIATGKGPVSRAITGVASVGTFGTVTPVVTGGGTQTAIATGLGSAQSFGIATVKTLTTRQVTGVPTAQQFGTFTIKTVVSRTVGAVASAQAFGVPTVKASIVKPTTGLGSAQVFGAPTVANVVAAQTVPVNGVTSAQRFGPPGYRQIVPVQGLNPYITVTSITGQVICGDGHLVGTFTYSPGQFGFVSIHTTVTRAVGGVSSTAVVGQVRPVNIQQPVAVQSAQSFGTIKAIPGPVFRQVLGVPSAQLFGHVTPHRYDLHVNCKPEGGFTMPPSTTGGFVLTPRPEGGFVLNPVPDTTFTLAPRTEGDFVITAVDEDG